MTRYSYNNNTKEFKIYSLYSDALLYEGVANELAEVLALNDAIRQAEDIAHYAGQEYIKDRVIVVLN